MKKLFIWLLICSSFNIKVNAQDIKRRFGIGMQSSIPNYGISLKYAITDQSVVQTTIAPFGVSTDGGSFSMNFYGARYIHRFLGNDETAIIADPYLYAGLGLLQFKATSYDGSSSTDNAVGYSIGGGVEFISYSRFKFLVEAFYNPDMMPAYIGPNLHIKNKNIQLRVGVKYQFGEKRESCNTPTYIE